MTSELFIENYRLDISNDISSLITFELDNIRDFAARGTSWSKTIVLPGTANNNKLFGHIFQIGQSNAYNSGSNNVGYNFNASKSARCIIFQDQFQTFKGVLRLMQINMTKGKPEYEVAVFGELAGLNVALSSGKLEDLDFSAYDHAFYETNIINSWDSPQGTGYYYPLIDYGLVSTDKHDWDIRAFRPALYVREYVDKMFTASGYRWSSALFDTARFKSFIIPHNQKTLQTLNSRLLSASRNNINDVVNSGTPSVVAIEFSSVITSIFTPSLSNSRMTYNGSAPTNLIVNVAFTGTYIANVISFTIELRKNGVLIPGTAIFLAADGTDTSKFYSWTVTDLSVSFTTGDYIEAIVSASSGFGSGLDRVRATNGTFFIDSVTPVLVDVVYGSGVTVNDTIPKNIRQIDFLLGIVKLFNLYVYEDRFDSRLIYLTPYIDFYNTSQLDAIDWTYKMNRDKAVKIKPMSELNAKKYEFKYKSDSDYWNDLYRKRYSQGYGDYVFDSEFEFAEQTKSFEILFSATPLLGVTGEDKVVSTIYKKSNEIEEHTDSNIRILQAKKISSVAAWSILDVSTVLDTITFYGYAGHLDDPDAPSNDLNFGVLQELFFILVSGNLSATQFNVYWSGYMAEITDKDSKLVSAWFYLKPRDILELDFSKKIWIDGVLFRLNSISDYNTTKPSDCLVELLKINYLSYSGEAPAPEESGFLLWQAGGYLLDIDGGKIKYA